MSQPHALALPPTLSPDALDVLTHLSTILSEVRTTLQASTGLETDNSNGSAVDKKDSGGTGLTFKDVVRASDPIKHKLQRAREQVRALPDMHRGIEEQEAEVRELEARIERQRLLLERLREVGGGFGKDGGGEAVVVPEGDKMET
ncbi:hypothetical protein ACRE_008650 [Hapsidospora chrysogenum ATCC 11550]|uniref:Mediator of RNA polymerase II transcription subunit 9 n=1 Tax=Hapsidospora chrysogenum (strain ATCC 11550 / CBS 779.69 / DSM 880 / IAM 14645 / JCM 23072 / IMI 49137) TaxID=857340 RepID=A0A086TFX2_HAPC1|nr:hypothetical protein ACRE_008650 [Hapsidospora chrysogenum ATCC 11550]